MKNFQKKLMLEELTPQAMMTLRGGDDSHDLVTPDTTRENYGNGGPPPSDSNDSNG